MKRLPTTPRSRVRSALRQVWLRSRERAAALKRENYCCEECGRRQTTRKGEELALEVHHREGILSWDLMIDYVFRHLLVHPDALQVLCRECHDAIHSKEEP